MSLRLHTHVLTGAAVVTQVRGLLTDLSEQRERDAGAVRESLPILLKRAATVPLDHATMLA